MSDHRRDMPRCSADHDCVHKMPAMKSESVPEAVVPETLALGVDGEMEQTDRIVRLKLELESLRTENESLRRALS